MNFANIPLELQQWPNWVVWRYEQLENGNWTKVPYTIDGLLASVTDPKTWTTFDNAVACYNRGMCNGIGFVFSRADPYCGVDLDGTTDQDIILVQQKIYTTFHSYSERSPSGQGLHIICRAVLPAGRRRSKVEIYSHDRFFTFTGDQFGEQREIRDCQGVAEILYNELGKNVQQYHFDGTAEVKFQDQAIVEMALGAANGDKFERLLTGDWQSDYSSQSEADFAFINIIAYYTQNKEQIVRIFRASPLGARGKAQRDNYVMPMVQRSFDRMLPPLDMDGLYNNIETQVAELVAAPTTVEPDADSIMIEDEGAELPRGLLGDIARYIYSASPRPVEKISLTAAIGLLAGIVGRAYNVSGTGLNMYLLMLANTGSGKEAISNGIHKLMTAVSSMTATPIEGASITPSARQFIGPEELASAPALFKALTKQPCFLVMPGEFGLKLQTMASEKASSNDILLKRSLLTLYSKSGHGAVWGGMNYSDKEKNVDAIQAPALSILGESTPETFYAAVDERMVTDGLLPRFLCVEYNGKRTPPNNNHVHALPSAELINDIGKLVVNCHSLNGSGHVMNVQFTPEAAAMAEDFGYYCDDMINSSGTETLRHLWNRAHLKLMKLAALVAVGANPLQPVIERADILWAHKLVNNDIVKLTGRFERGEVGMQSETDNLRQMKDMFKIMSQYTMRPYEELQTYGVSPIAHNERMMSHAYISRRLSSVASFRKDRAGSNLAIKRCLDVFCEHGVLVKVPPRQVQEKIGSSAAHYILVNLNWQ